MKALTIGAIVLCKVLISEPGIDGELRSADAPIEISSQPRIKEGEMTYTIIEGEVFDMQLKEYYAPIKGTGKFEKKVQQDLVIKSKEIDYLVISSNACGLKKELTEMDPAPKTAKSNKKVVKETKEEVIVIRGDQIPAGFEKVEDKVIIDKVKATYTQTESESELKRQEDFLKNLENDQSRFNKKKNANSESDVTKKLGIISPDEVAEEVKEIEKFEESPQALTATEAFKKIEDENVARLEKERKEQQERFEIEKKTAPKVIVPKKAIEVKPAATSRETPVNTGPEKSILKDALKIITNE